MHLLPPSRSFLEDDAVYAKQLALGGTTYIGWGMTQRDSDPAVYRSFMVAHGYPARPKG
jgi:hypothetical protein